jgi:hypothetical protein
VASEISVLCRNFYKHKLTNFSLQLPAVRISLLRHRKNQISFMYVDLGRSCVEGHRSFPDMNNFIVNLKVRLCDYVLSDIMEYVQHLQFTVKEYFDQ